MRRFFSIFLCLSFLSGFTKLGLGQSTEVTGTVFYRNRQPAVNCSVTLGAKVAVVDVKGRFRFENVSPGNYVVQIWCQGRRVKTQSVRIQGAAYRIGSIVI